MSGVPQSRPRFGTAGLPNSFHTRGFKGIAQAPEYLAGFGLNAFEYQCGRGVRLAEKTADILREKGAQGDILYILHTPYYISMSGMAEEKTLGSLRYFMESARAVRMLGGNRVVFHAGSAGRQPRARAALDEAGYEDILLCPETMGKVGQLGTLDEVLALCQDDPRHVPCIDFGHLNARTQGGIASKRDYADILDAIGEALDGERANSFHVHFSRIEYSAGGEKRHLTFEDTTYGPDPRPLLELIAERRLAPVVICESDGTQAEDAQTMMNIYNLLI